VREKEKARRKGSPHHFPGKGPGETMISFQRRHCYALFKSLLLPVALLLVCSAVLAVLSPQIPLLALALASLLTFGLLLAWMGWLIAHWQNDFYIVTNRRVIHLETVLFFYERRREVPLEKIQGVSVRLPNILARALRFGDLVIETAGGNIVFRAMPRAERMRRLVFGQLSQLRAQERITEKEATQERIRQELRARLGYPLEETSQGSWERMEGQVTWRKHWIILVEHAFGPLALLALGLYLVAASGLSLPPFHQVFWRIPPFVFFLPFLLSAGWFWWQVRAWRNDLYIVSDYRILDIKRALLRGQKVREVRLAEIQDVFYLIPHPLAWLLNYGNVFIETASASGRLPLRCVSNPQKVQQEIFRRMEAFQGGERQMEDVDKRTELADWFDAYEELASQGGESR